MDVGAFLVEQEGGDIHRHLHVDRHAALLHRLFLDDAQDVQRGRLGAADMADAAAARAGDVVAFAEAGRETLARQFQQAEARDLGGLHAGAVVAQRVAQTVLHVALVAAAFHVDEVDHDQAAEVAQAQLAGDLLRRLEVGVERGGLDVGALGGARRIDVDRGQRFGMVDHDRAAGRQAHFARMGGFNLVLDLEAREQRYVVHVAFDAVHVVRHDRTHERHRLFVDVLRVDQDFADFRVEVVADGAHHETAFQVDQRRRFFGLRRALNRIPQLLEVVQVPLQFFLVAPDTGGARDDAHAMRHVDLRQHFAQFVAIFAFHAARHAAAARVVRHQHDVAAGQADVGGQCRALVAALVFFYLYQQFLAFAQGFLDRGTVAAAGLVILRGDFLERQKAVAAAAVFDEAGFEAGFDAGDNRLVDVALALFLAGGFDVEVDEFLAVDNGDAEFFRLRRIE